jgi:hypothetical protein
MMNIVIRKFKATVRHDHGVIILQVVSTSAKSAIQQICSVEGCPESAILKIKEVAK